MSIKIGINGFGRIGRNLLRISLLSDDIDVVAINDIADIKTCAHLLKYDSVFGVLDNDIKHDEDSISIDGDRIKIFSERSPSDIDWSSKDCQIVVESTGIFTSKEKASLHLNGTVKKVIISAPAKGSVDFTTVMGANDDLYDPSSHNIISNASCTTNCLAPIAAVLSRSVGIEQGMMTTIHAVTNDQHLSDVSHTDPYRARSATTSMIPTKTGAAAAIDLVLPELAGRLDGLAVRVPTLNVSLVDLTFRASRKTSAREINDLMRSASEQDRFGILGYNTQPLVSIDFNHDPYSSHFDANHTRVNGDLVKVLAWYDNEWGFSNRMLDTGLVIMNAGSNRKASAAA